MGEIESDPERRIELIRSGSELLAALPDSELKRSVAALQALAAAKQSERVLVEELLSCVPPALHPDFLGYLRGGELSPALLSELDDPQSGASRAINLLISKQAEQVLGSPTSRESQVELPNTKSLADFGIRGLFIP